MFFCKSNFILFNSSHLIQRFARSKTMSTEMSRSLLYGIYIIETLSFHRQMYFSKKIKWHGAKSSEYGKWWMIKIRFLVKSTSVHYRASNVAPYSGYFGRIRWTKRSKTPILNTALTITLSTIGRVAMFRNFKYEICVWISVQNKIESYLNQMAFYLLKKN